MALIACPECRTEVSESAPTCPRCGYPVASSVVAAKAVAGEPRIEREPPSPDALLPTYYQNKFAILDAMDGRRVRGFNGAAFLFSGFWYLAKGMWLKALVLFLVVVGGSAFGEDAGWIVGIGVWIYAGLYGTFDYYLLHRHGQQGWTR